MSLRAQAISGVKWTGASSATVSIIEFVRIAILARLLSPSDFGIMTMVMVITGFSQGFVDMGMNASIIYRQDATREQLSSLYWLNIFAGIAIFGLVVAISPFISDFYGEPYLIFLIPLASLSFLIIPIGQQFQILLQKELRFNILAKIEILCTAIGMLVAVVTAIQGHGVFALIWGTLANMGARAIILIVIGWPKWGPRLYFRWKDLKGYLNFGLYQMGERSVNYLSSNVDYLLIGRFLGSTTLGFYTIAYQLVIIPLQKINPVLTRVTFPVFSKRQRDDAVLRKGYLEMIKLLSFVIFPILVAIAVIAPVFVPVILGIGWEIVIPLIQILVVVGILKGLGNPMGSMLLAKGRADIGFKWNLIIAIINTIVFWFVAQVSLFAVAWSWVILCIVYSVVSWWILYKVIGLGWMEYISSLVRTTTISMLMGIAVYIAYLILSGFDCSGIFCLISLVAFGVIVYGFFALLIDQGYVRDLWTLLFGKGTGLAYKEV